MKHDEDPGVEYYSKVVWDALSYLKWLARQRKRP